MVTAIPNENIQEIVFDSDLIETKLENNRLVIKTALQPSIIDSNFQELESKIIDIESILKKNDIELKKQENKINVVIETIKHIH